MVEILLNFIIITFFNHDLYFFQNLDLLSKGVTMIKKNFSVFRWTQCKIALVSTQILTKIYRACENCFYIVNLSFMCTFVTPWDWQSHLAVRLPFRDSVSPATTERLLQCRQSSHQPNPTNSFASDQKLKYTIKKMVLFVKSNTECTSKELILLKYIRLKDNEKLWSF